MEVQPRNSVVLRCKRCADRNPKREATHVGEAAIVRDRRGRWVIRISEARRARRGGMLSRGRRGRDTAHSGSEASFQCHACRATLTLARDRLQAAFAADCDSVLVGANGEIVLTYW